MLGNIVSISRRDVHIGERLRKCTYIYIYIYIRFITKEKFTTFNTFFKSIIFYKIILLHLITDEYH